MPILFRFDDGTDVDLEPWVTNGTISGTALLRNTSFGGTRDGGGSDFATTLDDAVVFRVSNDNYDGLWLTNGRASETSLLVDDFGARLYRQGALDFDGDLIVQGFRQYPFDFGDGRILTVFQEELLRIGRDGSKTALLDLKDSADQLTDLDSHFLFVDDEVLYGSDGTVEGNVALSPFILSENSSRLTTNILKDTSNGQNVLIYTPSDADFVFLNGENRSLGKSLWFSNGTERGTFRLDAIGSVSSIQDDVLVSEGSTYLTVRTINKFVDPDSPLVVQTDYAEEMWRVNMTSGVASRVAALDALYPSEPSDPTPRIVGTGLSEPISNGADVGFIAFGLRVFTDGNTQRTEPIADFYLVAPGEEATPADATRLAHVPLNLEFFIFKDQLVYKVIDGVMTTFFAENIFTGDVTQVLEPYPSRDSYRVAEPVFLGDHVVFATVVSWINGARVEIYSWDGTSGEAVLIGEVRGPYPDSSITDPTWSSVFREDDGLLYFVDRDRGLVVTDGTLDGTVRLTSAIDAQILGVVPFAEPAADGTELTFDSDDVVGKSSSETIFGLAGDDTVTGGGGNDTIVGDEGADSLAGNSGFDELIGGIGDDTLSGDQNADTLRGGAGNDALLGGEGFDIIEGGSGNDSIFAGAAPDRAFGGAGDDLIRMGTNFGTSVDGAEGGIGNDTIFGEGGFDLLLGGDGDDEIHGGHQADDLRGEAGNDTLIGGAGFDRLFGGDGDDLIQDFDGFGGLFGQNGNDTIQNGDEAVNIFGGAGNDLIEAGGGDDNITANAGFDTLNGGAGNDTLRGSFNADTFVFADGDGNDVVLDFDALNALEKIDLSTVSAITSVADLDLASAVNGAAMQSGSDVVIDTGAGNSVTLLNVSLGDLDASDFIF